MYWYVALKLKIGEHGKLRAGPCPVWEGSLEENGYMYMYCCIPLLFTWNDHNIVHWQYPNTKLKVFLKELAFAREVQWNGHPQTLLLRGAQIGTNFLRSKWAKSTQSLENVSTLCPMNSTFRNVAERNTHYMIRDFPYEDIHLKSYL